MDLLATAEQTIIAWSGVTDWRPLFLMGLAFVGITAGLAIGIYMGTRR